MANQQTSSFTFRTGQPELLTWILTDQDDVPVSGAVVSATLFAGRSLAVPDESPGVPVAGFSNVPLPETATPGTYAAIILPFVAPPTSTGFVVVITVPDISTWEIPAAIIPPGANTDLVTLDITKDWLGIDESNTDDDGLIQFLITAFSQWVLNRSGQTSFNSIQTYTEVYDGNGNFRLFLNNTPVTQIVSLTIGASTVPISTSTITSGVFIDQSGKSIAFRNSPTYLSVPAIISPYTFSRGVGNIQVIYKAGYATTPYDLAEAAMKAVAINYVRKDWRDLASRSLSAGSSGSGTTRYRDWMLPPEIMTVLDFYSRYARS